MSKRRVLLREKKSVAIVSLKKMRAVEPASKKAATTKHIELVSVSCPTSGSQNDCGVLSVMMMLTHETENFPKRPVFEYETLVNSLIREYKEFDMEWGPEQRVGLDAIESLLQEHLPGTKFDIFEITQMPSEKQGESGPIKVAVTPVNQNATRQAIYAMCLKSSWNRQTNQPGAAHFTYFKRPGSTEEIIAAFQAKNYSDAPLETVLASISCSHCAYPVADRICSGCLQYAYCSEFCADLHWVQGKHHAECNGRE
jgi:hypothetical protein